MSRPVATVLVGLGHRTHGYASFAKNHPDRMRIVALADPNSTRLTHAAKKYGISDERCFSDAAELAEKFPAREGFAEVAINGTMDAQHLDTSRVLLEGGYDILLEKPIATTLDDVLELNRLAEENKRLVVICHVLRHAPFYRAIAKQVHSGAIGRVMSMQSSEHVSDHHMVTAFVRGKWRQRSTNPMLLAKCCHDLDLLCWLKGDVRPSRVASMGGQLLFTPEHAPPGSGTRCLTDCEIESNCHYSARRLYIEHGLWQFYAWHGLNDYEQGRLPDESTLLTSLETDNPYGRCVWQCDNDVVDQQNVIIEFDDGTIASHQMYTNSARGRRSIHLIGEKGEIEGVLEEGKFTIRKPKPSCGRGFNLESIDTNTWQTEIIGVGVEEEMHGGGDLRLVDDFLRMRSGEDASISTTELRDSIAGHAIAFAADEAMLRGVVMSIDGQWGCRFLQTD